MRKTQMRSVSRRYRWDTSPPRRVDLSAALEVELPDDAIDRAVREVTGVDAGPVPVGMLDRIVELRVSGHRLRDLAPLAALPRLQRLWLRSPVAQDLAPLARLRGLRELTLVDLPSADLAPLGALERLERLRLERMPVRDLVPLGRLSRLQDLCLRRTPAEDLTPLAQLQRLRILELTDGAPLPDLSAIEQIATLRYVNLSGTRVLRTDGVRQRRPDLHVDGLACAATARGRAAGLLIDGGAVATAEIARTAERLLHWPCTVAGLALRCGQPIPFADNPWRLPARISLGDAIARVWSPLERRAPQFRAVLQREVAAVALIAPLGGDEPALAYVLDGCDCHPARGVQLLVGRAPRAIARDEVEGFRLPLALRELYSVHGGLITDDAGLLPPLELRPLAAHCRGRLQQFRRANRGLLPDQFRVFFTDEDGGKVLDLERLDGRGDPIVRRWYAETHEIAGQAPFWDWFEDQAPESFLHTTD